VGQVWSAVFQLLFIPVYLKLLGIEAYGLIGFYATLQGTLQILDLGLSPTMNRELARYSALGQLRDARDFVRTLQTFYWAIGIIIGAGVWLSAPLIATRWIHASSIPIENVTSAVRLMGVLVMLQWPLSFYGGGLIGLQRQSLYNAIKIPIVTLANVGAAVVLFSVSRTITAFLTWQIAVNALYTGLLTFVLWHQLVWREPSVFRLDVLKKVWRFAAGMTGIGLSALILTQLDKIILIKILPLREFGYYSLAATASNGLSIVITSVFYGLFPRFSSLVAQGDESGLRNLYRMGTQLMAVGILPAAAVMAFHSRALVFAWMGDRVVGAHAAPLIAILAIGTALNGLMNMPYALQLAYGWTRIGLAINAFLLALLVPAIFILATRFGAVGGASVWVALNVIYMAIGVPLTHKRLLKGETWRWFGRDVGLGALGAIAGAGLIRAVLPFPASRMAALVTVAIAFLVSTATAGLLAPAPRHFVHALLQKAGKRYSVWA
jgi:O-antigen/teichoic acid export membrane protein